MKLATVAAVAVVAPAAQAVVSLPAKVAAIPETAPTPIAALWADHKRFRRQYQALRRQEDQLEAKVLVAMPKPHPSITQSPENDAFGLKASAPGYANGLHGHIHPLTIGREITTIKLSYFYKFVRPELDVVATDTQLIGGADHWLLVHYDDPLPLAPAEAARLADLETRLRLSEEYNAQIGRVRAKLGLPSLERGQEKVLDKLSRIESRILKLPAQMPGDTRIKLALYQHCRDECGRDTYAVAESLVRDLRRALKEQSVA
jgi:hypothetical protein